MRCWAKLIEHCAQLESQWAMGMGNRNDALNIHQGVSVKVLLGQE